MLECAYGLRFVELNFRSSQTPWSVRQTVIYHRYEVEEKASTWIIISASTLIEDSLNGYIKNSEDLSALNPFEIHVILLDTALGNWRSYIIFLTEEISKQVCFKLLLWYRHLSFFHSPIRSFLRQSRIRTHYSF